MRIAGSYQYPTMEFVIYDKPARTRNRSASRRRRANPENGGLTGAPVGLGIDYNFIESLEVMFKPLP